VREIWFIVTLVTHSSVMSSSGSSRGIHHKCKHPLNPTKLYVSGWVESSRVVVYWMKSHNMLGCYMDIEWWNMSDYMVIMLLALAYPVYYMVVLYVTLLSCDDHQFNWWEQMGEVPGVSKGVEILLHSPCVDWLFSCMSSFRVATHVSVRP